MPVSSENMAARIEALEDIITVLMVELVRDAPKLRENILKQLTGAVELAEEREALGVAGAIEIIRGSFKEES